MNAYLWTWLARYGGACALAVVWSVASVWQGSRGQRASAAVLATLAGASALLLGTHLGPLLTGGELPRDPWALDAALSAPFLAFSVSALIVQPIPARNRFDLASLAPALLWSHGAPAWLFAAALVGRGHLMAGQVRRWLLTGVGLLVLATWADAHRPELRALALAHGLGMDDSARFASAVASGLELFGWSAVTRWAVAAPAGRLPPPG